MPDIASVFGRHEFVIRRLHSLTGLVPVGAFLFVHFVTNVSILDGPATFQMRVDQIHSLGPDHAAGAWNGCSFSCPSCSTG